MGFIPEGSGACQDQSLGVHLLGLIRWCYSLKLVTRCTGFSTSWKGCLCKPRSTGGLSLVQGYLVGVTLWSYWSLLILDLEACGRGHNVNQGQLSPVPDLGKLSKRLRETVGLLLTGIHNAQLLKCLRWYGSWVGQGLRESLDRGKVVFDELMQIQIWHQCWSWGSPTKLRAHWGLLLPAWSHGPLRVVQKELQCRQTMAAHQQRKSLCWYIRGW